MDVVRTIETMIPFLAPYPPWVKVVVVIWILYSALLLIFLLFFRNSMQETQGPAKNGSRTTIEQKADGDIVGRDKITIDGDIILSRPNAIPKNDESKNEIAKVKISRAFEDYDSAISELKRDFKDSSERIASQFSKRRMLASGAFIKAQMDLSVATKQKVYQKFVELDRSIQDILIKVFGKTSLAAMGKELDEELNRFNEKKAQLKEIYLMLENHPKDWELRVIGEHRATKGFDLTNSP